MGCVVPFRPVRPAEQPDAVPDTIAIPPIEKFEAMLDLVAWLQPDLTAAEATDALEAFFRDRHPSLIDEWDLAKIGADVFGVA